MSEIKFTCPHCQQSLEAPSDMVGTQTDCPSCGNRLYITNDAMDQPKNPQPTQTRRETEEVNRVRDKALKQAEEKSESFGQRMVNMDEDESDYIQLAKETLAEIQKFDYSLLKPMLRIFSPRLLKRRAVRWVAGFGLFPLLVLYLSGIFGWGFEDTAWFLGAYFCFFWIVYFNSLLAPSKEVKRKGLKWALFTMVIGIPLLFAWQHLPIVRTVYEGTQSTVFLWRAAAFILGVGIFEELCKALPLLMFGRSKPTLLTPHNAIYLGIMSGLGFALAEVVQYSIQYWQGSAEVSAALVAHCVGNARTWGGSINFQTFAYNLDKAMPFLVEYYGNIVVAQVVRFMSLPLLHAAWAGVVGYFVGLSLLRKKAQWVFIFIGVGSMATLHGLYNVFSNGPIGLAFAAGSILILMCYLAEEESVTERVRLAESIDDAQSASPDLTQ